jgi:cell division protein FtsA
LRDSYKEVKPVTQPVVELQQEAPTVEHNVEEKKGKDTETTGEKIKRSFFDKYVDKIKDFLDNAE